MGEKSPRILDASTAHRVAKGWTYGFPELEPGQAEAIKKARFVANPGCYATGAIALLRPLVDKGLLPADFPVSIHAVSGYSGGGKKMIADYERGGAPPFEAYALDLEHKHVPEIERYARLARRPIFAPSVGDFAQGMLVCVPLFLNDLPLKPKGADLEAALAAHYAGSAFVKVKPAEASGTIEPQSLNGTNDLELRVFANDARGQAILVAKLDNLGKGASGAAVQNLRLMLHHDETRALLHPAAEGNQSSRYKPQRADIANKEGESGQLEVRKFAFGLVRQRSGSGLHATRPDFCNGAV